MPPGSKGGTVRTGRRSSAAIGTLLVSSAVYLLPVLLHDLLWIPVAPLYVGGYLSGAVSQDADSCTKTGIQWNVPFQGWQVRGQLATTATAEDVRYQRGLLSVIGVGVAGAFFVPTVVTEVPRFVFSIGGFVLAVLTWLVLRRSSRSVRCIRAD